MEKKNLTAVGLCCKANITTQALRDAMKRNSTKTDIIERIAVALNVPVGYFFGESQSIVVNGKNNQVHNGQGDQIMLTPEQQEIEHLRELIKEKEKVVEEKERFIQLLLSKNGEK